MTDNTNDVATQNQEAAKSQNPLDVSVDRLSGVSSEVSSDASNAVASPTLGVTEGKPLPAAGSVEENSENAAPAGATNPVNNL